MDILYVGLGVVCFAIAAWLITALDKLGGAR
jgi:hypothetical protein